MACECEGRVSDMVGWRKVRRVMIGEERKRSRVERLRKERENA